MYNKNQTKTPLYLKNFSKDRVKIKLPFLNIGKIKVYLDGVEIKKNKGQYILFDDTNNQRSLVIKSKFLDPYPYIYLDGEEYYIVREHITINTKIISLIPLLINILLLKPNFITIVIPFLFSYFITKIFYKIEDEKMAFFYSVFLIISSVPVCYYSLIFISDILR